MTSKAPAGWSRHKLAEVADVAWGDTKTTKASYIEAPGGYQAFSASGPDGLLPHFDYEGDGVVLSAIGANCGRVFFARGRWSCIKNTIRLLGRPGAADTRFLYYATSDPNFWPRRGSAQPFISQGDARNAKILLPGLAEQERIAAVLGALDNKVDSNRRLSRLLEELVATEFRARFVDFVGIDNLVPSELGPIPDGWTVLPVGEELTVVGGATPSTKEPQYWNGGSHCWATPKDLSGLASPVLLDTERHITGDGLSKISSGLLPKRTVLLSCRAPVGYTAISMIPTAVNQGFIALPPTGSIPTEYVLFWVRANLDLIKGHASGTTFAEISKRAFRPLPMLVPSSEALSEFESFAGPLIDSIAGYQRECLHLGAIRNTLLPKLVSGEIRVVDSLEPPETTNRLIEEPAV